MRGLGSGMDAAGAIRMSTSPSGPSSNSSMWVCVCVPVRPPTGPCPNAVPKVMPEVGAVPAVPEEPVGTRVVEDAERVVHVRVVHQQLLVLVLEVEELGVQRVGLLHDPVEDQPGEAGHPAVPLGQVDV